MQLTHTPVAIFDSNEDGVRMVARISNRGEPYRLVMEIDLVDPDFKTMPCMTLDHHEAESLFEFLSKALGK